MKKIFTLVIALVVFVILALPVLAADGSSFENAIRLTPQPGDERGTPLDGYVPVTFTIEEFEQSVYFVFSAASSGSHLMNWNGTLRFDIYDSKQNLLYENNSSYFEAKSGETYYIRAYYSAFGVNERQFNQNAPYTMDFGIVEYTPETKAPGHPAVWIGSFIVFLIVVAFPYRRYMLRTYEFDPIERKPFLISFVLAMVYMGFMWFVGGMPMWPLVAAMAPAFIITSLKLLSKTREPKVLLINTALMLGFYSMMGFVAALFFGLVVGVAIFLLLTGALRGVFAGGGGQKSNPYGPGVGKDYRTDGSRGAGYYDKNEK